jgi:hypothetical protein
LIDLVFFPTEFTDKPEPKQRAQELNPYTFYVLGMRDNGIPYHPVYIDPAPHGTHGLPSAGQWPVILLIRDPHPTIYSWYHTATDRWGLRVEDRVAWIRDAYRQYREYYERGFGLVAANPSNAYLLRYEELKRDHFALSHLVEFIGVQPKLDPKFVHWWTEFERMTKPGAKTFFRSGNNARWREDEAWLADLRLAGIGNFQQFGYFEEP